MNGMILWVDDEIELLKPHILFLTDKGYKVDTCTNGYDAIEQVKLENYDLIILDEMMPGITGLETLPLIKDVSPMTPVIMVTKSEEENIMDKAVGNKIADYLIKPVNPSQVLLSIKKNVHSQQLVTEQSTAGYRSDFGNITNSLTEARTAEDWINIYKKLVHWDIELGSSSDRSVFEILSYQWTEANSEFAKFIRKNYVSWYDNKKDQSDRPLLSHHIMRQNVFPIVDENKKTTFLLIDNFRYDQWLMIRKMLTSIYDIETEDFYYAILPTATQYARNAIFAGLTPLAIEKIMPDLWRNDSDEGAKNQYEEDFLRRLIQSAGKNYKTYFEKLIRADAGKKLLDNMDKVYNADFSVIVYNFLDILSHARTETDLIRQLADDEAAFRSLTNSWFEHSDIFEFLKRIAEKGHKLIITSDHGTKQVSNPIRVIGDRETSTNLRYKTGKNLGYNKKDVFEILKPELAELPKSNLTSSYIFATGRDFFIYPNNYNHFVRYYKDTFQHGGVSMEEMIVPFVVLNPK